MGEKNQITPTPVRYGSYIRLIHYATGLTMVGANDDDMYDESNTYKCTYLRNQLNAYENAASQWQVLSRYRLRSEGDAVLENDFIVFRNFMFKDRYLTSIPIVTGSEHLVGLQVESAFEKLGWQIRLLLSYSSIKEETNEVITDKGKSKKTQEQSVISGSFIRLVHQELQGCMICRHDDGPLQLATLAPLGQICQKLVKPLSETLGVYVRAHSMASDPRSALSVWEILPRNRTKLGPLTDGDGVIFRHLLTGQYLCVRPPRAEDTAVLHTGSRNGITLPLMTMATFMCVATTSTVDATVVFIVRSVDMSESTSSLKEVKYNENVYFVHEQTRAILEIQSLGDRRRVHDSSASVPPTGEDDGSDASVPSDTTDRKEELWEEYSDDTPLRPCSLSKDIAVLSEAYRIVAVSKQEVRDILYVSKFTPLTQAALALIQHTPRMDEVYLPLFRHFNVALYSLIEWVANLYDSDGSLVMHPALTVSISAENSHLPPRDGLKKDSSTASMPSLGSAKGKRHVVETVRSDTRLECTDMMKCSSISPWIGRGLPPYVTASIPDAIVSDRDPTARPPSKLNTYRQNMISDSRLLDILLFFTTVVFRSVKYYMTNLEEGTAHSADIDAILKVPALVTGSCVLIHDLIYGCVVQNRRNSVRILAVKDTLVNLMDQEILGWRPPVEALLLSLQSTKAGTVLRENDNFSPTSVFSSDDINNLIKKTYDLYMANKESAVHLLELLTTLCSPGKVPDKTFQDLIARTVFSNAKQRRRHVFHGANSLFSLTAERENDPVNEEFHSLLFSTRYFNGSWEVHFRVNAKFDAGNLSVRNEKVERMVWEDMKGLKDMFLCAMEKSRQSSDIFRQTLTVKQIIALLEQLGLGGGALCQEAGCLYEADFSTYAEWFWEKRKIYFPSPVAELNNMTVGEVMIIIDNDARQSLGIDNDILDLLRDHSDDENHADPRRFTLSKRMNQISTVNEALGLKQFPAMFEEQLEAKRSPDKRIQRKLTSINESSEHSFTRDKGANKVSDIAKAWKNRLPHARFDQPLIRKMLMKKVPSFDIGEFDNFRAQDGSRSVGLDKSDMAHLGVFLR